VPRVTIQRAAFRKITTQLGRREELESVKEALNKTKVTLNPKTDAILWDPTPSLCKALAEILTREQTFSRKPDSAGFKLIEDNIDRLRKHGNELSELP